MSCVSALRLGLAIDFTSSLQHPRPATRHHVLCCFPCRLGSIWLGYHKVTRYLLTIPIVRSPGLSSLSLFARTFGGRALILFFRSSLFSDFSLTGLRTRAEYSTHVELVRARNIISIKALCASSKGWQPRLLAYYHYHHQCTAHRRLEIP